MTTLDRAAGDMRELADPWLLKFPPRPSAVMRLICVPGAGGRTSQFRPWANAMPESVEVSGVQLPGHGALIRQRPFSHVQPMAAGLAKVIMSDPRLPLALFGHSMGALVAYELARALEGSAYAPVHLFVAAHRAPDIAVSHAMLHRLPDPAFIAAMREFGGTPPEVFDNRDILSLMLPVLRADFEATETYRHEGGLPLDVPITVFGGREDPYVGEPELDAWRRHTRRHCTVELLDGGHFIEHPWSEVMLRSIAATLAGYTR
jgi:medium-chain acyl-[acyl-carrier-protein] hydrolase